MNRELRFRLAVDGAQQSSAAVDGVGAAFGRLERNVTTAAASSTQAVASIGRVGQYVSGLVVAAGATQAVRGIAAMADEYASLNARLRLATDSQAKYLAAQAEVARIAETQRKGLAEVATLYTAASAAAADLGAGQAQIAKFTAAAAAGLTLGGASAQAQAGALLQLSQAIGGSVVQAAEFNSLIDAARPLLQAAANNIDAAGGSVGRLTALVKDGKVTSRAFFEAVVAGSDQLQRAAADMPVTIGQATVVAKNNLLQLVGAFDAATGASSGAARAIKVLGDNIGAVAALAGVGLAAGIGRAVAHITGMVAALHAERAARIAALRDQVRHTEAVAIHTGFVLADTRATLAHAQGLGASIVAQNAAIAASARHSAALAAQTAAQTALNSATSIGAAALRLLGGPVGAVVTTLGVAATAWAAFGTAASSGNAEAADSTRKLREEVDLLERSIALLESRPDTEPRRRRIEAARRRIGELEDQLAPRATARQVDNEIDAAAAAARARMERTLQEYRDRYPLEGEKLTGVLKQALQDFGGAIPPEIADRIRNNLVKPTTEAADAAKRAAQSYRDWLSARGLFDLRRQDEADQAAEAAAKAEADLLSRRDLARLKRIDDAEEAAEREARAQIDAQERAARETADEWQRTSDQIGQSLADALMGGAQSAAESMKNLFRTIVLRPILQAVVNPAAGAITAALGLGSGTANAAGSGGSGVGGIGNLLSLAGGALGTFGSAAGVGLGATLGGAGLGEVLAGAGAMLGQGTAAGIAGGLGLGLGAIAPYVAAAAAVYYLGKAAFGRKLADTGVQGTFSGAGDFTGNAYAFYKGGWFRSDKTTTSPLDEGLGAIFDAGAKAVSQSARSYADALGLPASAIDGYSKQIQISLSGLNEQQIREKIEQAVAGFGQGLAGRFAQQLDPFAKAGETLAQTFERLAGIQSFSRTLHELGGIFARVAWLSIDAREHLFELAGGMQAIGQQATQFVQDYYGRDEIAGLKADEIQARLAAVGITQDIASREQFRALVDSLDVSGAKGREQLATLLAASGSFTSLSDYLAESGLTLRQAAAQAPDAGPLPGLFGPGGQLEQISAINNVALSVDRVQQTIAEGNQRLLDAIKGQAPAVIFQPWEVGGMAVSGGT